MGKYWNKLFFLLKKDIKNLNGVVLSFVGAFILIGATLFAYTMNSSYALFSYETLSDKILKMSPGFSLDESGANAPVMADNMIPVYYDSGDSVWRKADSTNLNENYQWYDYDSKMWANSVTVSDSYESTDARDLTAYEKNGSISGATFNDEGLSFDGTDDYVTMPSLGVSFPASYSIKFKTSSTANQILFGDTTTQSGLGLYNSNNSLIVSLNTASTVFNTGGLELNKFYTIDLVYTSLTSVKAYLNGNELSSSGTQNNWSWDGTTNYLGKRSSGTNFKGTIEKFIVYDDALTVDEINYNLSVDNSIVGGKGVIADNLKLYYNFAMNPREYYRNASMGTFVSMDDILTMQVWIPRYKYTVWNYNSDGTAISNPQEINITFENGDVSTGEISCTDSLSGTSGDPSEVCKLKSNNATCTDSTCNGKTYTHPAFTFGNENLKGFWVGKFEVSSTYDCESESGFDVGCDCNLPSIKPLSKPNVSSWRGAMVGTFDYTMRGMNDSDNIYGFERNTDTHMIKNMEWGAVGYLTSSKYGLNDEVAINSNENYITGCGPQSSGSDSFGEVCNNYVSSLGQTASTTGNVYGVYDMMAGAEEYVMGNIVSSDGETMISGNNSRNFHHSGYSGIISNDFNESKYEYPDSKYLDKYSYSSDFSNIEGSKLGDSVKEMIIGKIGNDYYTWSDFFVDFPTYVYPWFVHWSIDGCDFDKGDVSSDISSRVIIIPNSIETRDNEEIDISNANCFLDPK